MNKTEPAKFYGFNFVITKKVMLSAVDDGYGIDGKRCWSPTLDARSDELSVLYGGVFPFYT